MRCTSPRTVGFQADGKTIAWSQKEYSKQYAAFQLPCGKCIECRLDYARQWAIRCVHEAQMHEKNIFLTLTYDDQHLKSPKLIYKDWQDFMRKLRKHAAVDYYCFEKEKIINVEPIGMFVTGEYGDKTKRPHWHAILFNYAPSDGAKKYTTQRGDQVFDSKTLTKIWGHGIAEYGSVTFESAGYCARYAAKKLNHGADGSHDYEPISKKSSKHAIGKKWLEQYWPDVFNQGRIVLADGTTTSIPRYYEKWLKEHRPQDWLKYLDVKLNKITHAQQQTEEEKNDYYLNVIERNLLHKPNPLTPNQRKAKFAASILKNLQTKL